MTSPQIIAVMALMREIEKPSACYNRAVRRASQTLTDSPENEAAQARGNAALLEVEQAVRAWVAKHPEQPPARRILGTTEQADTVAALAVDRATVLREAADRFERECPDAGGPMDLCMCHASEPLREWADEREAADAYARAINAPPNEATCEAIRERLESGTAPRRRVSRLAAEAQQPTPVLAEETKPEGPVSPTAALLTARCDGCPHPLDSHLRYGACLADGCTCHRYQPAP